MAAVLRSHVLGSWHTPPDEGRPLYDAVTGAEVARLSSAGIDFAAALDYGRRVGGPALRELTFHQRAALLKALAGHLREHREELYAVSAQTGATRYDSRFDVDGGHRRARSPTRRGAAELPDDTVYVEGDVEPLSKGGTFLGQHIATPLHGVAVQINAFNFPVWGPLEKLAPAFLAGVPIADQAGQPDGVPHGRAGAAHRRVGAAAARARAVRRGLARRHARPPDRAGPRRASPARPPRRPPCARTPASCGTACGSPPRPTRSTSPRSAPTPPRARPSSTSTSASSSPR